MPKATSYSEMVGDWQRLLAQMAANGEELAHLEVVRARLEVMLGQMIELNKVQAERTAAKQESSRQLRALAPEGQRLANLLRQAIKQNYGIRAEKLAAFGLQPFRGRPRKVKPSEEDPTKPPPGSPEAAEDPQR